MEDERRDSVDVRAKSSQDDDPERAKRGGVRLKPWQQGVLVLAHAADTDHGYVAFHAHGTLS